jgi:hypothetical protein
VGLAGDRHDLGDHRRRLQENSVNDVLKVGDEVMHRDGFGTDPPRKAKVLQLERTFAGNPEDTEIVQEMSWEELAVRGLVILNNGKWAYGSQIDRIDTKYDTLQIGRTYKTNDGHRFTITSMPQLSKNQKHYVGACHDDVLIAPRYFTETGGCIAYFRGDDPVIDAARSIATDEIDRTNKEKL